MSDKSQGRDCLNCSSNSRTSVITAASAVSWGRDRSGPVWHLHIPKGRRCNFHRHVLTYFWTAHNAGLARGYFEDGRIVDTRHYQGETRHLSFGPGEYMVHSVENIGDTDLLFTTVEFLDSGNPPLPIPDEMRLRVPEDEKLEMAS